MAVEAQEAEREQWMTECGNKGYSEWTCNRFDPEHIEIADRLDEFRCERTESQVHHCRYVLGDAEVMVAIPTSSTIVTGEYVAPELRSHAVINRSNIANANFVAISESGRIELRDRDAGVARFVINPSTGTLNDPALSTPTDADRTAAPRQN